jgi:AraC-like DNA-binding protein
MVNESDSERMNAIYKYLLENFKSPIYLADVARIAHMTPPAFSRYFRSRTKKTFSQVLNEIRIGHACALLLAQKLTVFQIAEACGFENLSNFNRTFRMITHTNPTQYLGLHSRTNADSGD